MYKTLLKYLCIPLSFLGCKTYQKANPNDITYAEFTNSQKHWISENGNVSYIDKGEGKPILLLHGIPTSGWLYRKMIDPLVAKGYRVIAPDMLGFGNSNSPEGYDIYDKKEHAKRILGLMEYLNIPNWHHLMHDAGGLWTWEMLKMDNSKINKLTILNTIIYKEGFEPPIEVGNTGLAKLIKWSYNNNYNLMTCQLFKGGLENFEMSKRDIEGYKEPLREQKTDALHKFFTTNTKSIPDYSDVLKSLDVPTQVIWGINDEILKWEAQSEKVISDLKIQAKDIHILNKNHFLQEEVPDDLVNYITAF